MFWVILILGIGLLGASTALVLQRWNLKKMNKQLEEIIEDFGTNETLRTNLPGKELNQFISKINHLIALFKKEEQMTLRNNKELKQEITNISHDIRTPLTSIKGFSELLHDPSLTEEDYQEYLLIIEKKVDSLLRTANLFYEISQINSEETLPLFESFPLGDILVETLLTFEKDFKDKLIEVEVEEAEIYSHVYADKKMTERIILNLVQNALRYSESIFRISVVKDKEFVVVKAFNDTPEINNLELTRLFERSFTVDQSRQKGQTGLGLYIVKQLVDKQAGWVKASYADEQFLLEVAFKRA